MSSRVQRISVFLVVLLWSAVLVLLLIREFDPYRFYFYLYEVYISLIVAGAILSFISYIFYQEIIVEALTKLSIYRILSVVVRLLVVFGTVYFTLYPFIIEYPFFKEYLLDVYSPARMYIMFWVYLGSLIGLFWMYAPVLRDVLSLGNKHQKQRDASFQKWITKRPSILQRAGIQSVIHFFYSERWSVVGLLILMGVTAALRLVYLDHLEPYTDEYSHLIAAKDVVQGTPLLDVYRRSLLTVTVPVAIAFSLFEPSLFIARLPGALSATIAVIPLYVLLRRINRPTALLGVFFYATNPWLIATARNVREYAYYPLIYFLIIYVLVYTVEQLPKKIILKKHIGALRTPKGALLTILWLAPVLFFNLFDELATGKVILLTYVVAGLFLLQRFDFQDAFNRRFLAITVPIGASIVIGFGVYEKFVDLIPQPTRYWFNILFNPARQQWYHDMSTYVPLAIVILALFAIPVLRRKHMLLYASFFCINLYFFSFHFSRYLRPRYGSAIELFFVMLLAISLYIFFLLIRTAFHNRWYLSYPIFLAVLFSIVNVTHVLSVTTYAKHDKYAPITGEYHDKLKPTFDFIEKNRAPEDVLISTIFRDHHYFFADEPFEYVYQYDSSDPKRLAFVHEIVNEKSSGFIVVDQRRNKNGLPYSDFFVGDTRVNYLGKINAQFVYYWNRENGSKVPFPLQ